MIYFNFYFNKFVNNYILFLNGYQLIVVLISSIERNQLVIAGKIKVLGGKNK